MTPLPLPLCRELAGRVPEIREHKPERGDVYTGEFGPYTLEFLAGCSDVLEGAVWRPRTEDLLPTLERLDPWWKAERRASPLLGQIVYYVTSANGGGDKNDDPWVAGRTLVEAVAQRILYLTKEATRGGQETAGDGAKEDA